MQFVDCDASSSIADYAIEMRVRSGVRCVMERRRPTRLYRRTVPRRCISQIYVYRQIVERERFIRSFADETRLLADDAGSASLRYQARWSVLRHEGYKTRRFSETFAFIIVCSFRRHAVENCGKLIVVAILRVGRAAMCRSNG